MIYNQIKKLCRDKKISASKMITDLELSQNIMTKWKNGTDIKASTLIKIANYFNTTTDFLLGIEKKENTTKIENNNIANIGKSNRVTIKSENKMTGLENELLSEIKKMSKLEQSQLLTELLRKKEKK